MAVNSVRHSLLCNNVILFLVDIIQSISLLSTSKIPSTSVSEHEDHSWYTIANVNVLFHFQFNL